MKKIMKGINEYRLLKKYEKLYINSGNLEKMVLENDSYEKLIQEIEKIYRSDLKRDKDKIFCEKVRLESNIVSCEKDDFFSCMSAFISLCVSFVVPVVTIVISEPKGDKLKKIKQLFSLSIDNPILFYILTFLAYACFFIIIYTMVNISNKNMARKKAFNTMCLKVLGKIEKENEVHKSKRITKKYRKRTYR